MAKTRKCPECKGKGYYKSSTIGMEYYGWEPNTWKCPTCKGTGKQHQGWVAG